LWANLELRHLLALQAVAESGSFHKAAARLGYTQSAISSQIAALERLVGHRLVDRSASSRPVRLTESGELVLSPGRVVLSQVSAAQADLAAQSDCEGTRLRLGAFQSVGGTVVPALMSSLAQRCPELKVELTQTISDDQLFRLLSTDELDVVFAM